MKLKWFNISLWGSSVALSWMWGLGLFFSVQFTHQFGLFGLLTFAIPNALGLILFGVLTQIISQRGLADSKHPSSSSESLAQFFNTWARPFRLVFYLYQLLAITLTVFAIIRYLWQPLRLQPDLLYLPLTILIVLAAGCLFGEEFNIKRIKYSHGVLFLILLGAVAFLWRGSMGQDLSVFQNGVASVQAAQVMAHDLKFWGYIIPICVGFLLGPWLDLQQWQRAIQMRRENTSITQSYIVGGILFFLMLLFHGSLALWGEKAGAAQYVAQGRFDSLTYAQGMLTSFFFHHAAPWLFIAYAIFICICILTTLDSGYIALRWFLAQNVQASKNALLSLVPNRLLISPVPSFIFAGAFTLFAAIVKLELEYFMVFYATFFVGYAALAVSRCFTPRHSGALPQVKMFCIGSLAVVLFAYGYFLHLPGFLILGSILPLGYVIWLLFKPEAASELVTGTDELESPLTQLPTVISPTSSTPTHETASAPTKTSVSGHFEDKWFVHTFLATYADTNSVGNVYFGMYAMWVGKTRELFFNRCLPKFNLKTSPYYILTRSFTHKFMHETREFEEVRVKIRVSKFNRKFATLEHEIYDSSNHLLGKGEQSLMFVSSSDYGLIDIPQEVLTAFASYT